MFLRYLRIAERKQKIFRILAILLTVLIVFHLDIPIFVLYGRLNASTKLISVDHYADNHVTGDANDEKTDKIVEKNQYQNEKKEYDSYSWESWEKDTAQMLDEQSEVYYSDEYRREEHIDDYEPGIVMGSSKDLAYEEAEKGFVISTRAPSGMQDKDGWGRNVSRRTTHYIDPESDASISHFPSNICSIQKPLALIIVCSDPRHHKLRQAIRRTWGRNAHRFYRFTILFIMGNNDDQKTNERLFTESHLYQDLIFENFHDSYNNLTLKTIYMLKWIRKHCSEVPFIVKMDDDTYVNSENLYRYIMRIRGKDTSKLLVGKVASKAIPYRDVTHRWYMPFYIYQPKLYPNYTEGVAYLMSQEVARKLYYGSLNTDIVFLEDVFITGICAQAVNITPIDQEAFRFQPGTDIECGNPRFIKLAIVAHKVNMHHMYRLHWEAFRCSAVRV